MIVQWYPGHMSKAKRMMETDVKLVDLVIEVIDARAPVSSRNPDIDKFAANKSRLIIMNKSDLADNRINDAWKAYFEHKNIPTVFVNSKNKEGLRNVLPEVKRACEAKILRDAKKGIKNQPVRAMVVGIPNVGKSTFINAFSGKNVAKTGNKPGVTVGKQWIRINKDLELLDTPGILWPKFEDQNVGMKLAFLGSINDEILVPEELAGELLLYLKKEYPLLIESRYGITEDLLENLKKENEDTFTTDQSLMLDIVAKSRGLLKSGGVTDYFKAAGAVIEDFRSGKIGKISLEKP